MKMNYFNLTDLLSIPYLAGKFGPLEIGRVYVEDEDDWDLPDKTFTFAEPLWLQDYFL